MGLVWVQKDYSPSIVRILLPGKDMAMVEIIGRFFPCAVRQTNDTIEKICGQIQEFMKGNKVDFSLGYLDMNNCYEFQRKVLLETERIPKGMVISYGRLAGKIHVPQGARAVGSALAGNPFPVIIPCHRVIRSNGELGGFGGGLKMKRTLLEMEGVGFDSKGRVSRDCFW
ncbi:MAG: methylated-DNA--[protein]-cysteine S-methyltransferase [Proteobacteria bacterium]|nr:methylated-DNA--[protein]-cysteine S-methyltransferase [Pseudomonadota bacterium]